MTKKVKDMHYSKAGFDLYLNCKGFMKERVICILKCMIFHTKGGLGSIIVRNFFLFIFSIVCLFWSDLSMYVDVTVGCL